MRKAGPACRRVVGGGGAAGDDRRPQRLIVCPRGDALTAGLHREALEAEAEAAHGLGKEARAVRGAGGERTTFGDEGEVLTKDTGVALKRYLQGMASGCNGDEGDRAFVFKFRHWTI